MGIRILQLDVLIDTFDYSPVYPGNVLGKSEVIEFEAKVPFPATKRYTREMMIADMHHDHGAGILSFTGLTSDQKYWIELFLNESI